MISFTVVGNAEPAGSKKAFVRGGRAQVVDANPRAEDWKGTVAATAARVAPPDLLGGPLVVEFTFYRPRPKGHYGARGLLPSAPLFPATRPDLLKLSRAAEDAITGVIWRDDAQIVAEYLFKLYGHPARCVVKVWEAAESPALVGMADGAAA